MKRTTFDPARDLPLYYCGGCAKEKRRNYCVPCGTEDNTLTNWIPDAKPKPRRGGKGKR